MSQLARWFRPFARPPRRLMFARGVEIVGHTATIALSRERLHLALDGLCG
ncbi:MAG: hypothetical protein WD118_10190 [Phycisphaeraceae bacterium]